MNDSRGKMNRLREFGCSFFSVMLSMNLPTRQDLHQDCGTFSLSPSEGERVGVRVASPRSWSQCAISRPRRLSMNQPMPRFFSLSPRGTSGERGSFHGSCSRCTRRSLSVPIGVNPCLKRFELPVRSYPFLSLLLSATLPLLFPSFGLAVPSEGISLAGQWRFELDRKNAETNGQWFARKLESNLHLPGSLPEQGIGDEISVDTKWTGDIVD